MVIVAHLVDAQQNEVEQPPHAQSAKGEQFEKAEKRRAEIKAVCARPAEKKGKQERRPPIRFARLRIVLKRMKPLISVGNVVHGSVKFGRASRNRCANFRE
jgi:hypothetical protein